MARPRAKTPGRRTASGWRRLVFERDGGCCQKCGRNYLLGGEMHVHHIVAHRDGGKAEPANGVLLCAACHLELEALLMSSRIGLDDWLAVPPIAAILAGMKLDIPPGVSAAEWFMGVWAAHRLLIAMWNEDASERAEAAG